MNQCPRGHLETKYILENAPIFLFPVVIFLKEKRKESVIMSTSCSHLIIFCMISSVFLHIDLLYFHIVKIQFILFLD